MYYDNLKLPETDLWHYLTKTEKPVVLYGMGNGAEKIYNKLMSLNVKVSDFFASDEFVRGHSFLGYKVQKLSEIRSKYDDCIVLLCFATSLDDVIKRISDISKIYELYAPDVPVAGSTVFDIEFAEKNYSLLNEAYKSLADIKSKEVFQDIINYKLSGDINYLFDADTDKREVFSDILKLSHEENFLDLGAYNGDTVRELLAYTNGKANKILAVEPDRRSYKKLCKYVEESKLNFIQTVNCAVSNENSEQYFSNQGGRMSVLTEGSGVLAQVKSVDAVCGEYGFKPTYIKMDLEGEEYNALKGALSTVKVCKPKLLVSAYHRSEDIFKLIIYIKQICPEYNIFLRKHKYIPAWDVNIYAV